MLLRTALCDGEDNVEPDADASTGSNRGSIEATGFTSGHIKVGPGPIACPCASAELEL